MKKRRILCGFRHDLVLTAVYSQAKEAPEGPPRLSYSQGLFKAFAERVRHSVTLLGKSWLDMGEAPFRGSWLAPRLDGMSLFVLLVFFPGFAQWR